MNITLNALSGRLFCLEQELPLLRNLATATEDAAVQAAVQAITAAITAAKEAVRKKRMEEMDNAL
jgi:hypothetical protein